MLLLAQEQRVCSVSPLLRVMAPGQGKYFKPYLNVIVILKVNIKGARISDLCCMWKSIIGTKQEVNKFFLINGKNKKGYVQHVYTTLKTKS